MSEITELLTKIGMNEKELKAYETVVAFGFHTAGQVAHKTEAGLTETIDALDSLVSKNYLKAKEMKSKEGTIYYPMAPKIAISADLSKSLSEKLQSLSVKISEIWGNAESSIDSDTTQLIENIKNLLKDYSDKINQLASNSEGSIQTWYENTKFSLEETTNENVNEFKSEVTTPLREISTSLTELGERIKNQSNQSMSEINEKTEAHKASIEGAVESIKTELYEFADEVGFILSGRISGLNQMIENSSSESSEKAETIINTIRSDYDAVKSGENSSFEGINSSFVDDVMNSYSETTQDLLNSNTNYKNQFNALIDTTLAKNTEVQESTIASSGKMLDTFNDNHVNSVEDLHSKLNETINTVQENAVSQLNLILSSTSAKLGELQTDISSNLNQHHGNLSDQLNQLTSNVDQSFNQRFDEIKELLSNFVSNLKESTSTNVEQTTNSIKELKDFLQTFLVDVQENLDSELQSLKGNVANTLTEIVSSSSGSIENSVEDNKLQLSTINDDLNEKLSSFQNSINDFLINAKSDLESRLTSAQEIFREGVDAGVAVYKTESQRINEIQSGQLEALKEEAEALSSEANKARSDAIQAVDNGLVEVKKQALLQLNDRVNADVEKISREISRFNERLDRELNRFYEDFQEKTVNLRDDVPQSIENMFLGQTNQLEGIRRQFDSNRRFISDFFEKVENDLQPGEKNWKNKDFQTEFHGLAQRIRSDFNRFDSEITRYFEFALEDTEEIKNEVLSNFNRTIEDEVSALEELVSDRTSKAKSISGEFKDSLSGNTTQLTEDMTASINDSLSELTSNIKKTMLTKFEQPLESIISKAQAVATGTEGVDQENRIIKAQNLLISVIDSAVEQLAISLEQAFEDSVADLDSKVEETINESREIVGNLQSNITGSFDSQNSTIDNFASSIKVELTNIQSSVNEQLNQTIDATKSNVSETFNSKNQEVESTVSEKTNQLHEASNSKLVEVDNSLDTFKGNLDQIKGDTMSQVQTMVSNSIDSQKQALDSTLSNLNEATEGAKGVIVETQSSLDSNVGSTLSQIQADVKELVTSYKQGLDGVRQDLASKIGEFYNTESKVQEIEDLKTQVSESIGSYLTNIRGIENDLSGALNEKIVALKGTHEQNFTEFTDNLMAKITELAENNSNFIFDLFDQVSTQMSSIQGETLGSIENAKGNIDHTVTNSVETVRTDILNPANEVVNAVNQSTNDYADKISELTTSFDQMADQEDGVIETARSKLIEKLTTSIEREKTSWQDRGKNLYGDQSSTMENFATEFESKVSSATSQGKEAVSGEIAKIPNVVEETLEAAARSMELLNEITKGSIDLDPKTPDTSYFDTGKEAIIANLNAILDRTKSSGTIVVPNLSWINPDTVSNLSKNIKIVIDANQIGADDQEILSKIKELGLIDKIRQVDSNRLPSASGAMDMIMATRDREEIMISKLFGIDQPYAFVSQDDYFIEKFTELIQIYTTMPPYKG